MVLALSGRFIARSMGNMRCPILILYYERALIGLMNYPTALCMYWITKQDPRLLWVKPALFPQLALEGVIAREGGFENVSAGPLSELSLMRLRRGKEFGDKGLSDKKMSAGDYAEKALKELTAMVIAFSSEDQGYISRRVPFKDSELSGDYDHLARSREWSLNDESEVSQ